MEKYGHKEDYQHFQLSFQLIPWRPLWKKRNKLIQIGIATGEQMFQRFPQTFQRYAQKKRIRQKIFGNPVVYSML